MSLLLDLKGNSMRWARRPFDATAHNRRSHPAPYWIAACLAYFFLIPPLAQSSLPVPVQVIIGVSVSVVLTIGIVWAVRLAKRDRRA